MKKVEIFTDGACKGNPGPGGWGAILRYGKAEKGGSDPGLWYGLRDRSGAGAQRVGRTDSDC